MMPFERDVTALEEITNRVGSGRSGPTEYLHDTWMVLWRFLRHVSATGLGRPFSR